MINKLQTPKGIRYDILQNGESKHQMGAITNLTLEALTKIMYEIETEIFDNDLKQKTRNGVHPHFGKIK